MAERMGPFIGGIDGPKPATDPLVDLQETCYRCSVAREAVEAWRNERATLRAARDAAIEGWKREETAREKERAEAKAQVAASAVLGHKLYLALRAEVLKACDEMAEMGPPFWDMDPLLERLRKACE